MMPGPLQLPVWGAGLLAGVVAFGLNLLIARVAVRVLRARPDFAPLTAAPLFAGSVGGVLGATAVYALLDSLLRDATTAIYGVTVVVWVASVSLPLLLFRPRKNRSERFAGFTPAIGITLFGLHTVVALCSLYATRFWRIG